MATNGTPNYGSANPSELSGGSAPPQGGARLSKDQVGWYFVEQYYNTLSKTPEKLHLFYNKRSQFVCGNEAQVASVSVGRQPIQERIKDLDLQDCKVRIANVDSQGSTHGEVESIVIQVIGEMSNKGAEPKKFVQTFVLAQQPSGYFVLNDILRYIEEEPEEEASDSAVPQDADTTAAAAEVEEESEKPVTKAEEPAEPAKLDAAVVDKKLEEVSAAAVEPPTVAAEPAAAEPVAVPAAQDAPKSETTSSTLDTDRVTQEIAEEEAKKPEAPKDPSPTPVAPRVSAPPPPAEPAKPKEPPKPMTWASRLASVAGPRPVVPIAKTATPPATQARAPAPLAAAATQPTPAAAAKPAEPAASKDAGEWQTAGNENKRQARPQSISQAPHHEKDPGTLGYLKYVSEKVVADDLKAALNKHGEVIYFDINRAKNCAFVEFKTVAGYQAAANANPHVVNGEEIQLEPRRPKPSAFGGSNFNPNRGGMSGRGRGGFDGGRGGGQGRGGFGQARGRGGPGGAPRGRGSAQPTNA